MKEYSNFNDLQKDYPDATWFITNENKMQCPNAKFVRAVVGLEPYCEENDDYDLHLMALFDLGTPDMLLWIWIPGVDDPYIDEYYEVPSQEAETYLASLK
jgi:hypothetical protein